MSNSSEEREKQLQNFLREENLPQSLLPLVNVALTHKSYSNEFRNNANAKLDRHNQRLEFLGDSVLGLIVADYFYSSKRKVAEGGLTRLKSMTVCESALKQVADTLHLGELLRMGKGEITTGGLTRVSNLADAMEATIGAIYVGAGYEAAQKFVLKHFHAILENPELVDGNQDFKSTLQEYLAKKSHLHPEYKLIAADGPDHEKEFTIALFVNGVKETEGVARTRKQAEQNAAREYMSRVKERK